MSKIATLHDQIDALLAQANDLSRAAMIRSMNEVPRKLCTLLANRSADLAKLEQDLDAIADLSDNRADWGMF